MALDARKYDISEKINKKKHKNHQLLSVRKCENAFYGFMCENLSARKYLRNSVILLSKILGYISFIHFNIHHHINRQ